jgi:hypothetical protein
MRNILRDIADLAVAMKSNRWLPRLGNYRRSETAEEAEAREVAAAKYIEERRRFYQAYKDELRRK